jgi:hypothetical protein
MNSRPGQSRLASLAESLANVLVGFLLALIRSFLLRRIFEASIAR